MDSRKSLNLWLIGGQSVRELNYLISAVSANYREFVTPIDLGSEAILSK